MLITQKKQKNKSTYIHLKADEDTLKMIKENAEKYTNGNVSAWLKYAGTHCVPPKKHIVKNKK